MFVFMKMLCKPEEGLVESCKPCAASNEEGFARHPEHGHVP